jgi:ribulose-phosphate 3-epimerase
MMCADIFRLEEVVKTFEDADVDYLHIDVMDGAFVPNLTLGVDYVNQLRNATKIPLDIHLMVESPEEKVRWLAPRPGDMVSVHVEATTHLQRILAQIRDCGASPGAALNPATPLSALDYVLDDLDAVLIMTVNPGYSGQTLIPATLEKIADFRRLADGRGYPNIAIETDGNVTPEYGLQMASRGADILVLGTSAVFRRDVPLADALLQFRNHLESAESSVIK